MEKFERTLRTNCELAMTDYLIGQCSNTWVVTALLGVLEADLVVVSAAIRSDVTTIWSAKLRPVALRRAAERVLEVELELPTLIGLNKIAMAECVRRRAAAKTTMLLEDAVQRFSHW